MADLSFPLDAPPTDRHCGGTFRTRPALRLSVRWSLLGLAFALSLGCVLAVLLRLTWKDSLPALAFAFYATPLALVWSGLAASSSLFFLLRKPALGILAGLGSLACWGSWQHENMIAAEPAFSDSSVKVVFWNAARLKFGWDPVARQIQNLSAPLMGFVEAGPDDAEARERWHNDFPDHQPVFFGNGMVLLLQGTVLETGQGVLGRGSFYGRAVWERQGQRVTVFLLDIHSNPFFSRAETLGRLTDLALQCTGPVVLMGDFNTPADSVHFETLRGTFQNAFEAGGRGNLATWPVPCPVLAIDHIWTNRQVAVHGARHDGSLQSDHQAVLAELSFWE